MEKFGCFIGQLVFTAIYMVIAALAGHLATVYIALFSVGMFFLAIASVLMEEHNGIGRVIVFCIGMAFIIIPAFVLNIIVIVNKTGSIIEISYFLVCVALVFTTWITCGFADGFWYMLNFVPLIIIALLSIFLNAVTKNVATLAIIYLVLGLIVLLIMIIMRIANGSALND